MMQKLYTWRLKDRGYDCDQHSDPLDITSYTLLDAVRYLDGFASAVHLDRLSADSNTYVVYGRAYRSDGVHKIGCVSDVTRR